MTLFIIKILVTALLVSLAYVWVRRIVKENIFLLGDDFIGVYKETCHVWRYRVITFFAWLLIIVGAIMGVFSILDKNIGLTGGSVIGVLIYSVGFLVLDIPLDIAESKFWRKI